MSEELNDLELAILNWFRDHYESESLLAQISAAKFKNRKWTKVGFYVDLDVPAESSPIDLNDFQGHWPINGPDIQSDDIEHGGISMLWGKEGRINCIEMAAIGSFFRERVKQFVLSS